MKQTYFDNTLKVLYLLLAVYALFILSNVNAHKRDDNDIGRFRYIESEEEVFDTKTGIRYYLPARRNFNTLETK